MEWETEKHWYLKNGISNCELRWILVLAKIVLANSLLLRQSLSGLTTADRYEFLRPLLPFSSLREGWSKGCCCIFNRHTYVQQSETLTRPLNFIPNAGRHSLNQIIVQEHSILEEIIVLYSHKHYQKLKQWYCCCYSSQGIAETLYSI